MLQSSGALEADDMPAEGRFVASSGLHKLNVAAACAARCRTSGSAGRRSLSRHSRPTPSARCAVQFFLHHRAACP